jgi:peroxiredoxin
MLLLSLLSSLSVTSGHADSPIADTAADIEPLVAGDAAPTFVVRSVDGDSVTFDPASLEQPAVIISFRGGWCPYCNMHLSELRHVMPEIDALGVDVMFLSGDRPDQLYSTLSGETQEDIADLGYTLYSDADANAALALGIAFRASERTFNYRREKGQDIEGSSMRNHGVLPVPSVFAVGTDGVIAFAYSNADYKVRLAADELLDIAREIATP